MNNDHVFEDSSDLFHSMAQMFVLTIRTNSFVDTLTCSDEVQPSTASFIALQQLQTEVIIDPTEIALHSTLYASISSVENPYFVQQNTGTTAVDHADFPLVSDEEISEIYTSKIARATKS